MAQRVLVPANMETPVLEVMRAVVRELGSNVELVVGFVEIPELAGARRIPVVVHLIDAVGQGRTNDIYCRLARVRHDNVLSGVIELVKRERIDTVALHTPSSQPELESGKVLKELIQQSLPCAVRVFNLQEAHSQG